MKKFLVFSIFFVIMASTLITNVSAIGLSEQFKDVTVGEVEKNNTDDEEQNVNAPDTGIFGLESEQASIVTTAVFVIPVTVILAFLFRFAYSKKSKKAA